MKALAALALTLLTAPLAPAPVIAPISVAKMVPPIDHAARGKFPKESAGFIDALSFVNRLVNRSILPMEDQAHYGVNDKAVSWPDDGKGDCEDYALSKLTLLGQLGVPIVNVTRLRFSIVRRGTDTYGHAVLEILMPGGSIAFLDNRHDGLMTRAELEADGYEFFDWGDKA